MCFTDERTTSSIPHRPGQEFNEKFIRWARNCGCFIAIGAIGYYAMDGSIEAVKVYEFKPSNLR